MNKDFILISGGAGFIGLNFLEYVINKNKNFLNIDNLSYSANLLEIKKFEKNKNYKFIKGDISNKLFIRKIFKTYSIKGIINFAAESHVDNSIKKPQAFIKNNIIGTFVLLNEAYKSWMERPFKYKANFFNSRFYQISTDEVYGSAEDGLKFNEGSPLKPNSPYSSSKAACDLMVRSYNKTYNFPSIVTNCSNNFGPRQFPEKLIPLAINKLKVKLHRMDRFYQ